MTVGHGVTVGHDDRHAALISKIAETAGDWINIDYPVRKSAEEQTLASPNRFTEEALVFAINQQMSLLTHTALRDWVPSPNPRRRVAGVLNPGNIPFVGLQDFLAVLLCGHEYRGSVSSKSPFLLPAFAADLLDRIKKVDYRPDIQFVDMDDLIDHSSVLIASGSDDTVRQIRNRCQKAGFNPDRLLFRGHRFSVAVISGHESEKEYEALSEDILMHEGLGCRNVSIVFAPAGISPDPLLEAMARFRAVFPAHPDTAGSLQIGKAFLKAVDQSHACEENLEFLVSRGEPEVQIPGHLRWTEFEDDSELTTWLEQHAENVQLLVSTRGSITGVPPDITQAEPGHAQRPTLSWCPDGKNTVEFLLGIL